MVLAVVEAKLLASVEVVMTIRLAPIVHRHPKQIHVTQMEMKDHITLRAV